MTDSDIAIYIENVTKKYRLGVLGRNTLRAELEARLAARRGLPDPNSKIGQEAHVKGDILYALRNVDLKVKKGERLGIIGSNGSGKSTLLKLICRITSPSEGYIGYNGRVTSMLEVGMGFHGELTGRENIYMSGAILGMSRKEVDSKIDDIVEFSEVGEFIDTPIKRYSSGMYVRLGFAVSAFLNAETVIMDEVLAVGDVNFQEKCIDRMREISVNDNKTILYVSHNMFTVHALCDRCIVLDKGQLVYDGNVATAEQIYREKLNTHSDMNLESAHRRGREYTGEATLLAASFPDAFYEVKDEIELNMKWRYNADVEKINLRIEIWNENNRPVGSKVFYDLEGGKEGTEHEETFRLDVSSLRNGNYRMVYVLFFYKQNSESYPVDMADGLAFAITDPEREERFMWHRAWWGSTRF